MQIDDRTKTAKLYLDGLLENQSQKVLKMGQSSCSSQIAPQFRLRRHVRNRPRRVFILPWIVITLQILRDFENRKHSTHRDLVKRTVCPNHRDTVLRHSHVTRFDMNPHPSSLMLLRLLRTVPLCWMVLRGGHVEGLASTAYQGDKR